MLNKIRIPTSIKGCNFVAKLRKITFYNPKVDLVKDNVYCLSKSIRSQDIEEKLNSDIKQGSLLCCKLFTMTIYNLNVDLVYDNVYTKIIQ